jgi:uncharacterized protein (TIGR00255 family)
MLFSMTGFGKGECVCSDGTVLGVQISSVNRKQFELRCSLPSELTEAEVNARKAIAAVVSRGAVQLRCTFTASAQSGEGKVNTALLDQLIRECRAARVRGNLTGEVAVEQLLALPGVFVTVVSERNEEDLLRAFECALQKALENYNAMRCNEGEALKNDLLERIGKLEKIHQVLAQMSAGYPDAAKQRLLARIEAEKLPVAVDDPALLRELLFYVDRGDVTEELTRLSSHFQQFRNFLDAEKAVGRSLDFLAQEIFREITTFGNKSAVPETAPLVVEFKSEMEKIREQIQNIE